MTDHLDIIRAVAALEQAVKDLGRSMDETRDDIRAALKRVNRVEERQNRLVGGALTFPFVGGVVGWFSKQLLG